jgi:hypothetical protein
MTKTFFHRVEPSKKVSFHLNPIASDVIKAIEKFQFPISVTTKVSGRVSIFSKFKALIRDKFLMKPSYQRSFGTKETAAGSEPRLNIVTLLLTPKETTGPPAAEPELVKQKKAMKKVMKLGSCCDGNNMWLPLSKRSKGIPNIFFSGKWAFLTSALAIRSAGFTITS